MTNDSAEQTSGITIADKQSVTVNTETGTFSFPNQKTKTGSMTEEEIMEELSRKNTVPEKTANQYQQTGWICPRCGAPVSPMEKTCPVCNGWCWPHRNPWTPYYWSDQTIYVTC